ncbi:MAG: hypothetical protein AAB558_01715, partial [Patescibacteria group bacterium]
PEFNETMHNRLIEASRNKYATPLAEVEAEIAGIDQIVVSSNGTGKLAAQAESTDTVFEAPLV